MSKKYSYEFVKSVFESNGYTLLSKEYIRNSQRLDYICPVGHRWSITFGDFKSGKRCLLCSIKELAARRRVNFSKIEDSFREAKYTLLTKEDEYINNRTVNLRFICPEGHSGVIDWSNWKAGNRCGFCKGKRISESKSLSIEHVKEAFENRGYTLVSDNYVNAQIKIDYICDKGHRNSMTYANFYNGRKCPQCFAARSKAEIEIYDFVKSYFPDTENNNRTIIHPLELDIVIPSKKIAIEYCGLYWHSELNGTDKNYHLDKLNKCNEAGYKLITIFEDEYVNHKDIVYSRLSNILGISDSEKVFARKCIIKEISYKESKDFLDKNHLQGAGKDKIRLGLFFNSRLVSVMTFSTPSIAKGGVFKEGVWELNRFSSDINLIVIGAASKLLKYFVKNYDCKSVFSYADRRWSDGGVYKTLGFKFVRDTQPNYWYLTENIRLHRFGFRKSELKSLDNYSVNKTEKQIMFENGFDIIWDCGNKKFELF